MAKAAKKPEENTPTKKKPSLAANRRKRRARAKANPAANPPAWHDFTHVILPGFAAYGAVRVLQRIAFTLIGKRWPRFAKHAHAATGVIAAGGAWAFAHKLPKVGQFHDAILMGSGVAALQGVYSAYVPKKYGWLLSDCDTSQLAPATSGGLMTEPANLPQQLKQQTSTGDDDDLADLEAQLGSLSGTTLGGGKSSGSAPVDDALAEELGGEDLDDLYAGAFAN